MLSAINTKVLISILAALVAIGGMLAYHNVQEKRAADAAAKAAAILKQQQDEIQAQKDREAAFWKKVEQDKKRHNSMNNANSGVWKSYLP
jgi:Tfp pilus assembly protein PilV